MRRHYSLYLPPADRRLSAAVVELLLSLAVAYRGRLRCQLLHPRWVYRAAGPFCWNTNVMIIKERIGVNEK